MKLALDLSKRMLADIERHLNQRAVEIDGRLERARLEDNVLSRVLAAGRAAGYGEKRN